MDTIIKEANAYIEEYNSKDLDNFDRPDLRDVIGELESYISQIETKHKDSYSVGGWCVEDIDNVLTERLEWEGNLPYQAKIDILDYVSANADGDYGINWDSLEDATETYLKDHDLL